MILAMTMKLKIKKYIFYAFIFLSFAIFQGCATVNHHNAYKKRSGLLMLKNTEMSINKKYNSRHNQSVKRKSSRKSRR